MKNIIVSLFSRFLLVYCLLFTVCSFSQDTFSICAVDTVTGEVGGAGASCIDNSAIAGGVVIINAMHPGKGVIHTQSYWLAANQNNANTQFNNGLSPQQLMVWLQANDAQSNPAIRQYGAVDIDSNGSPRADAFTGANCMNYKNHIVGPNYTIQGNILLGQQILDSMEARFLNEPGSLACKLMAALQGANVVGADTRCMSSGNSSLSSFLRVAKPTDVMPNIFLNLVVKSGPAGFEPIDSLQTLFNAAHSCATGVNEIENNNIRSRAHPNPTNGKISVSVPIGYIRSIDVHNVIGDKIYSSTSTDPQRSVTIDLSSFNRGLYFYRLVLEDGKVSSGKIMKGPS